MNAVPIGQPDTLPLIFNRGLIGALMTGADLSAPTLVPMIFSTWVISLEILQTGAFSHLYNFCCLCAHSVRNLRWYLCLLFRCDLIDVVVEIDRILRPGRWFVLKDTLEMIKKIRPILKSRHYETVIVKHQFLVATKSFWRPGKPASTSGWHIDRTFRGVFNNQRFYWFFETWSN